MIWSHIDRAGLFDRSGENLFLTILFGNWLLELLYRIDTLHLVGTVLKATPVSGKFFKVCVTIIRKRRLVGTETEHLSALVGSGKEPLLAPKRNLVETTGQVIFVLQRRVFGSTHPASKHILHTIRIYYDLLPYLESTNQTKYTHLPTSILPQPTKLLESWCSPGSNKGMP